MYTDTKMIEFMLDPTNNFKHRGQNDLLAECGYVPEWVLAFGDGSDGMTIREWLHECYGFPMSHMGGEVTPAGIYKFPEDPDLYPLLNIVTTDGLEVLQWQYGMVGMRDSQKDEWFVTRMD